MRNKVSIGEYLAFLSTKHEIDPDHLFQALVLAENSQEVTCGELTIRCRSKAQNRIVVLITKGQKVVAQFPVNRQFLLERRNPIRDYMKTSLAGRLSIKRARNPLSLRIKDLRNGMKQICLKARIIDIPEPRLVYTRFGNYASVSNALITDETGTIKLCLWNEQIQAVSTGDTVQIENASMSAFRGERQLRIGRKGKLSNIAQLSLRPEVPTM